MRSCGYKKYIEEGSHEEYNFSRGLEKGMSGSMPDYYDMRMSSVDFTREQLENMYPDIYHDVYPLIMETVDDMVRMGYAPSPEMINATVDGIIKNTGMWDEDDDMDLSEEAIPVQMGFGRQQFRRRRRRDHNRNTLRDIIRILLLRELLGRGSSFPGRR